MVSAYRQARKTPHFANWNLRTEEPQIWSVKRQKEKAPPTKGRRSGLRLGNGLQKGFDLPEHLLRAENIISVAKVQFHAVADSVPDLLPVQRIDG